jgi:OOP family OmpA-OmpF porin
VPDRLDRCPRTPAGASVDARGCPLDADGDGVADGLDRCPRTPAGVRVDGTGCPLDSDRDGIADDADRCANTPAGAQVDASGCPVDSDGDGVADSVDQCPDTPANARPVDARGCPADSDRDGVPDYLDRCASTAAGTPVNAAGCPVRAAPQPAPAARAAPVTPGRAPAPPAVYTRIVLRRVNFRPNRAMIPAEAFAELDSLAAAIVAQPGSRWEVAGYTSSMGNAAANLRLSRQRALAVRAYLIGKGVPGSRLVAVGRGSRNPIASNATVAGRRANMRVEIRRLR